MIIPSNLLSRSRSEAMAAPEDQTSSSAYVQEGDKVISDLPAQLLGNLDDAKEEFDSTAGQRFALIMTNFRAQVKNYPQVLRATLKADLEAKAKLVMQSQTIHSKNTAKTKYKMYRGVLPSITNPHTTISIRLEPEHSS